MVVTGAGDDERELLASRVRSLRGCCQEDFLKAAVGDPAYYTVCKAYFICGTTLASEEGTDGLLTSNFVKSRELLKKAGYDGTPIVLLHSTDLNVLANLAPVAKHLLEKAGFTVDMQSMDWQTLVTRRAKKEPPNLGGWHGFFTATFGAELLDPAIANWLTANCEKALPGWPCDAKLEEQRRLFARELEKWQCAAATHHKQLPSLGHFIEFTQWVAEPPITEGAISLQPRQPGTLGGPVRLCRRSHQSRRSAFLPR
jgi:peptide/nickel transport system substrate-binding protein